MRIEHYKHHRLFGALVIATLCVVGFTAPALSQEVDDATPAVEEIVVTGSRLVRSGFDTPSPVVMIGAADIQNSTAPALGDLLNDLPQFRSTFALGNSSRFIGTAGVGRLDLRGLGTARTLVLVNGRRHVSSSEGQQSVDVNSIPPDMIERIEVITGANSAVYGADAVAGVVNFILKDDFEGTTFRASTGTAGDSDFGRESMALTAGRNFSDNRGNAIFSIGYDTQDNLVAEDRGGEFVRSYGTVPNPNDGDTIDSNGIQVDDGIPDRITVPRHGFWAISYPGASLGLSGMLSPDGSFAPIPFADFEYSDGLRCGGDGCPYLDLVSFDILQPSFDRLTLDANFKYDLTDTSTWYFESRFSNVKSKQNSQPTFDFNVPIIIQRDNAFMSPSLAAAMDDAGVTATDFRRFNIDLGLREEEVNRSTIRMVSGIKGDIGDSTTFDVSVNYGRSNVERVNLNNRIDERWLAATDAVAIDAAGAAALVSSGLNPGASAGDIVCRSTLLEAQGTDSGLPDFAYEGCSPANVLGFGLISQEAKDFVNSTALGTAEIEQTQFQAILTNNELFELWAGPVAGVLGLEHREESSFVRGDSLSALGNTFFNNIASTVGDYSVSELFVEGALPLSTGKTLAQDLTLEAAVRYSDYSTIGETVTWEARLNWQPIESLRFRMNQGEAFRAPTISDLFSPNGENFNDIDDPCDMQNLDLGTNGRNVRIANCQALGIADPASFDSLDESSIPLLQGGNPGLQEEVAKTKTIGFVYTPGWAESLQLSLDWYDIEIEDAIAFTASQSIADRCVDDPNGIANQFCALVTRDAIGNITLIRAFPLNLNTLEASGIDFEIDYGMDLGRLGTLDHRLIGSFLDRRVDVLSSDNVVDVLQGELGNPELQVNYRGLLSINEKWDVSLELRWLDSMYIQEQELLFGSGTNNDPNPDVNDNTTANSVLYVDLGVNFVFDNGIKIGAKIDNLTDENPPFALMGNGGGSGIYDNIGRFYTVRASWGFDH